MYKFKHLIGLIYALLTELLLILSFSLIVADLINNLRAANKYS